MTTDDVAAGEAEIRRLRREIWFHHELLAALGDERPLQALIARLGQLVRGTAVLYDETGRIAASVGEGPVRLLWHELDHRERVFTRLDIGRYRVLATPIVMRGAGFWVALASRDADAIEASGEPLLLTAGRMLSAMRGARTLALTQELTRARHLITILLGEVTADRVPSLRRRLRELRFTVNQPLRAVVATPVSPESETPRRRVDRLEAMHERAYLAGLPLVLSDAPTGAPLGPGRRSGAVLALVADEPALGAWLERLAATHVVGVSEPFTDLLRAPAAYRDAGMALRVGLVTQAGGSPGRPETGEGRGAGTGTGQGPRRDRAADTDTGSRGGAPEAAGAVVHFEDVDLATWLTSSRPAADLEARTRRQFGALLDKEDLRETLVVHLALGSDVNATARQLYLHPNTVRYRLRRVEDQIGGPLGSAAMIANLYLALQEEIAAVPRPAPPSPPPPGPSARPSTAPRPSAPRAALPAPGAAPSTAARSGDARGTRGTR